MIQKATADRLGANLDDVDQLLKGLATDNVSQRLGLTQADIQDFIRTGVVSANVSTRLALPLEAVDELAKALGQEGRMGMLIGLMLSRRTNRRHT